MPWRTTDVRDQRIAFVIRAASGWEVFGDLCREFGVSRPTGYRWLGRYREAGSAANLVEHSRRPHRSPTRTLSGVEARVIALRQHWGWGGRKLCVLLAQEGIVLPEATVNRILKRHGLVAEVARQSAAPGHFERAAPNELWQMDHKGEMPAGQDGWCYPLSIIDDHSRFAVGLYASRGPTGASVHRSLLLAFASYGVPDAILIDHGTPWWSTTNGHGLTWVSAWLIQQGIRLVYSGIRHPQTQGKVERFHETLKAAVRHDGLPGSLAAWAAWLPAFRAVYNEVRPHESLGMQTPITRYRPSERAYNPYPPEWEYPHGAVIRSLNTQGCLPWNRQRYFVCEALAQQRVRIESVDNLLLVSYPNLYIREIDLQSGRTRPLLEETDKQNV